MDIYVHTPFKNIMNCLLLQNITNILKSLRIFGTMKGKKRGKAMDSHIQIEIIWLCINFQHSCYLQGNIWKINCFFQCSTSTPYLLLAVYKFTNLLLHRYLYSCFCSSGIRDELWKREPGTSKVLVLSVTLGFWYWVLDHEWQGCPQVF